MIKKSQIRPKKFWATFLVLVWFLNNWLVIWQSLRIPLRIKEVLAAQVTIDTTVNTTPLSYLGGSPTTVFIDQNTGYVFYRDSNNDCSYSKTTNGGITWATPVNITDGIANLDDDCMQIAVWYDQWTPEDTGSLIHLAVIDSVGTTSVDDDIWYANLNTTNDSITTFINITTDLSYAGTLGIGVNHVALAKATDGVLFAAVTDVSDNIMVRCTSGCTTATNWSVSEPNSWPTGNDFQILIPRLSGEMMLIWWDISASTDDLQYARFTNESWSAFSTIDTALDNSSYDASFGAAVDSATGDIYLSYAVQADTLGTDDDIKVKKFSGTSWTALTDVVTNSICAGVSNCGITGVKIARDQNTGYLYVLYSAQSTPNTASTGNVYWKYSTDAGSTWSSEFGPLDSTNDDIYGARLSLMSSSDQRIYATWIGTDPDDLFGRPIAPKTFQQSAYRFFTNTDSTDVGSPLAAQDTAVNLTSTGQAFRLRMLLHIGISDLFKNEGNFKLQFAQRGADNQCDTSFSGETYADVTAATVIAYNNNVTPTDGVNLTENANDPTHDSDTVIYQTYEEANNFTNSQATIDAGKDGKWDFSLKDNGAPANTTYCFRIVKSDGTNLETYSVIPQITTFDSSSISISVSDGEVLYGIVPKNTAKTTLASDMPPSGDMQTVSYDTSVTVNINIKGYDASGGGCTWILASSSDDDQYVHQFCNATDNNCSSPPTNYTNLTTSYQTLKSGVSGQGTVDFHLRIVMPTNSSCYGQQSVNVTLQAAQS